MAPISNLKRPRANDDDDEVIAVESASSSLRHDVQHKKARISGNAPKKVVQQDDGDSDESSDSDFDLPDAPDDEHVPPATQYEILRDNGFKHLANPDHDDQLATQRLKRRQARQTQLGDNRPAENAIIESIECINFMCHDRLHVELGPLINFVVGHNGSGKSAVLTALTLCLGGKASATNRGGSLKDLIKNGKDQALLIIKLKNGGPDAYQPEVYGETIIVERHFSRTGSSSFKLKSENERTISTKKGDVDDVVDYFQLQVDNPMNVLTQDEAKSFITKSTPKDKYAFFVKGVQLDTLDRDYKLISDKCDVLDIKLKQSREDIEALKIREGEAKRKKEEAEKDKGLRDRASLTKNKLAWSQVLDKENILIERENMIVEAQRNVENAEQDKLKKSDEFLKVEEAIERHRNTARQVEEEGNPLTEEAEAAKKSYDQAQEEAQTTHRESHRIKADMESEKKSVAKFQKSIEYEEKKLEEANGGAHARKQTKIQEAEHAQQEAHTALKEHERHLPGLISKKEEAVKVVGEVNNRLDQKQDESRRERKVLEELNSQRAQANAGFPQQTTRLLNLIRDERRWNETPIGPLGTCIRLTDMAWSPILEKAFGASLNGFVVTNSEDERRLFNLIAQANMPRNTPVVRLNHEPLRQLNEPDGNFMTILRALQFDNELAKKALIIGQGIEQTILVPDRGEAVRIMTRDRPRNAKRCFCFHPTERKNGFVVQVTPNGGNSIDPIKAWSGLPRMKTDNASRVKYQQETVQELGQQLASLETEKRQAEAQVQKCKRAIDQHVKDRTVFNEKFQRAEEAVETLRLEFENMGITDGRLEGLKMELNKVEERVEQLKVTYGDSRLEKERLNHIAVEKKREYTAVKARVQEQEIKLQKSADQTHNLDQVRFMSLKEKNLAVSNVEAAQLKKQRCEKKRDEAKATVDEWTILAQGVSDRVAMASGETHEELDKEYQRLRKLISEKEKRRGATAEQLNVAFAEAHAARENAEEIQRELEKLQRALKHAFSMRLQMFRRFQTHISSGSRMAFLYLLAERAFRGKMKIDHKNKMLDVRVQPDDTNKSSKGRKTKALSGGEKSFTSVCVLLALWEAMSAPLRCLDEFDVFMDDVNRDVSTKMIISAARRSVGRQFILITPKALGTGVAEGAKDVHIIKLFDPRQKRIDEMGQ